MDELERLQKENKSLTYQVEVLDAMIKKLQEQKLELFLEIRKLTGTRHDSRPPLFEGKGDSCS